MEGLTGWAPILGLIGLLIAGLLYRYIMAQPAGNEKMRGLAQAIHDGAMVFLKQEYKILAVFVVVVFILIAAFLEIRTAVAFLGGAVCSVLAGFFGMKAATRANLRTAEAARAGSQGKALSMAFFGGSIMGLSVASLGLVGVGFFFWLFAGQDTSAIFGFAMGASSIALFARVEYRKTAVGSMFWKRRTERIPSMEAIRPTIVITSGSAMAAGAAAPRVAPMAITAMMLPT